MLVPKINKKRLNTGAVISIILLALASLASLITYLTQGKNIALFNTKGLIAQEQLNLILYSGALLLAIGAPTVFLLYFTAWKYRESNAKAVYKPNLRHSKWFSFSMWAVPSAFILVLALAMWPATHRLAPNKSIAADVKPIRIQVVSLRWKWVFLYPEQKVATVNFVQVPVNTPVIFELTADEAPMSSFWIPNLGGQLYSMTGHVNQLNLIADKTGDYPGSSAEINGAGFAGMKFNARVSGAEDFVSWVEELRQSPDVLDAAAYESLVNPSESNPAAFYSAYENDLYNKVVMKYMGSHSQASATHEAEH